MLASKEKKVDTRVRVHDSFFAQVDEIKEQVGAQIAQVREGSIVFVFSTARASSRFCAQCSYGC